MSKEYIKIKEFQDNLVHDLMNEAKDGLNSRALEKAFQEGMKAGLQCFYDRIDEGICDVCEHYGEKCLEICNEKGLEVKMIKKWFEDHDWTIEEMMEEWYVERGENK